MTWLEVLNIAGQGLFWIGLVCLSAILISLAFLVAVFFVACAMYCIPYMQSKINLKGIAEIKTEQRIYLDEYQFTIASESNRKKLENEVKTLKDVESKIRKKSAELKSVTAQVDAANETKKKISKKQ